MRKRYYNGDHQEVSSSLNNLAFFYQAQGKLTDAEPLYMESLEMMRRIFKNDHPELAKGINNLAGFYQVQGKFGRRTII